MYLGTYTFNGDPDELLAALRPHDGGLPDKSPCSFTCACAAPTASPSSTPARATAEFHAFSTSPEFRAALGAVGLPEPTVDRIGDVHFARTPAGPVPIG